MLSDMGMMINRRRVYSGKKLPYDAEVEYLESTGTQYIDTLLYGNKETAMEIDFMPTNLTNQQSVAGSRLAGQNTNSLSIFSSPTSVFQRFGSNAFYTTLPNAKCVVYIDKICLKVNGVARTIWSQETPEFTTPTTIFVFRIGSFSGLIGRVYSFKLWQSGVLVIDFVPVRVGITGYMYDKVSGQLFGNDGTGDFILGPDV